MRHLVNYDKLALALGIALALLHPATDALAESGAQDGVVANIAERSFRRDSRQNILARSARAYRPTAVRPRRRERLEISRLERTERYEALIDYYSDLNGVEPTLVKAIVYTESGGDARAVSSAGAAGLMQLMPATARQLGVRDRFNAEQSIRSGTRYLRTLLDEFGSQEVALWAYNAGPGNARAGRMPSETQDYVPRVLRLAKVFAERKLDSGSASLATN